MKEGMEGMERIERKNVRNKRKELKKGWKEAMERSNGRKEEMEGME